MRSLALVLIVLTFTNCQNSKRALKQIEWLTELKYKGVIEIGFWSLKDSTMDLSQSPEYQGFLQFQQNFTEQEQVELTNNNSPVVCGYAFWSLAKQKSQYLKPILAKHLEDSMPVRFKVGCIVETMRMDSFMLKMVTKRIDNDCLVLNENEILALKNSQK
jgi:hypothetical protein